MRELDLSHHMLPPHERVPLTEADTPYPFQPKSKFTLCSRVQFSSNSMQARSR